MIGGFRSVLYVSVFQGSLPVIVIMIDSSKKCNCEGGFWTLELIQCCKVICYECFYKYERMVFFVCAFWLVKNLWFIVPVNSYNTWIYFVKAIDHTFYGFTGVITPLGFWENTQQACKSLAFRLWFTSFSHVLPTSWVGYHAGKPIESVFYCLNNRVCPSEGYTSCPLFVTSLMVSLFCPFLL